MVSHVRVALSNIPSLLCWLLLLPSGTALSHLEVKTLPQMDLRSQSTKTSTALTHAANSHLLFCPSTLQKFQQTVPDLPFNKS